MEGRGGGESGGLNRDAVNERTGEITEHLLKAGSFVDRQKLVRWLTLAGKSALDAAAFGEARRNFRSALSHHGAVGARETADLLPSPAMADRGLDLWDMGVADPHAAPEIYVNPGETEAIWRTINEC